MESEEGTGEDGEEEEVGEGEAMIGAIAGEGGEGAESVHGEEEEGEGEGEGVGEVETPLPPCEQCQAVALHSDGLSHTGIQPSNAATTQRMYHAA